MSQPKTGFATDWTKEQVESLLREEQFAYHRIELPYGLATAGADRSATADAIFPADLRGKSVLDVGCKYGFFCFEAARRGAARVVGLDVDPDSVRKARLLASCLASPVEFELADIERESLSGEFDYVLCLNVLHHLADPIAALAKLGAAARERLVLEVATFGWRDLRKLRIGPLRALSLARSPVLYVAPQGVREKTGQSFFVSQSGLEGLLAQQGGGGFARIEQVPSGWKNRFLTVAERRSIERMLVVAGPTSSGKSTLIERLQGGALPELADAIGLDKPAEWPMVGASQIARLREPRMPRLIFHYDTLYPYLRSAKTHEREKSLRLLDAAGEVVSLTIWTPPDALRRQLEEGEIGPKTRFGFFLGNRRYPKIQDDYRHPERIFRFYQAWFDWLLPRPGRHFLVTAADGWKLHPAAEWREYLAAAGVRGP